MGQALQASPLAERWQACRQVTRSDSSEVVIQAHEECGYRQIEGWCMDCQLHIPQPQAIRPARRRAKTEEKLCNL